MGADNIIPVGCTLFFTGEPDLKSIDIFNDKSFFITYN